MRLRNGGTTAPRKTPGRQHKPVGGQQAKQPNPVTAPLEPKTLRKEVRSRTNLEYRPLERKLGGELRASNQRVRDVGNWWGEYLAQVAGLRADTTNAYANAATQTQGLIDQSSAIDTANTQRLNTEEAASAALRGQAPSGEAAQREAAAQAQRNYLSSAMGGANAARGANQYAYLTDKQRIGAGQSIASRREEQKRGISIRQDQRELAKSRGDFAVKTRGDLRDKERDYLIQRRAFPLEKQKLANEASNDAYDRSLEERKLSETERHNRASEKNSGGLTPSERRERKEGKRNASAAAKTLFEKKQWPSWAALTRAVQKESEVSPADAADAVKKLRQKFEREQKKKARIEDITPDLNPFVG